MASRKDIKTKTKEQTMPKQIIDIEEYSDSWVSLTLYADETTYNKVSEKFIAEIKLENDLFGINKRDIHTAIVQASMMNPQDVVDHAKKLNENRNKESELQEYNIYLPQNLYSKFNEDFFMQLQLQNPELKQMMKRVLHQSSFEVGMKNPDTVVDIINERIK